jgi:hypothetical protein|tara:strand:- start:47 stop:658 length:612 start_codon:yes stop_codon:yes gene_type:complete
MNPYIRRLNSFSPVTIAQAPIPGQAVGNMDGIPLEALQGTSSPEQLRQEGMQGGYMPPGFGGPITGGPQPKYVTDLPIKASYTNIYGTNIGGEYNPTTGDISGQVVVPIGQAEKGYRIGVQGNYNPGRMDAYGMKQPAGFGGMIRFSKSNPVNPNRYETAGAEKYAIQVGVDGRPRRVPPQMAIPIELPGASPGLFENLLQQR